MVTLLKDIYPEYYKYFIYTDKRGRKYTYTEANQAIYETLGASLLFWGNFQKA